MKTPLDGVLSASRKIPIQDSSLGFLWIFILSNHWLAERTPSNGPWPIILRYPWGERNEKMKKN